MRKLIAALALMVSLLPASAQIDEDQLGAWYMYFWDVKVGESGFGIQGDFQYRNWDVIGDLEQLLLRGGLTYRPKDAGIKLTLGYANIQTGAFGESSATVGESRIYQEALIPQKVGKRFYFNHRFRYEQRFVEGQDLRTRYRYNLFINVALNKEVIEKGTIYFAFYNELFINGQRDIGNFQNVEIFDRNRTYGAFGYAFKKSLKVQLGAMRQVTDAWGKTQLQLSLHQNLEF
jgi:hypothetical protein